MRRPSAILTVATAVAALTAVAPAALASHTEPVPLAWTLANISPSGTYLQIEATTGGCLMPPTVITKTEDSASVTIAVDGRALFPDPGGPIPSCPAPMLQPVGGVLLDHPLGGRRLTALVRRSQRSSGGPPLTKTPRLVGANAGDAMRALANLGLTPHLNGHVNAPVVRQRPAGGTPLNGGHDVTLVSR